jgi:hypothetical protein
MELLKVTDTAKIVTDPVLALALKAQGVDKGGVAMEQDYGRRDAVTDRSPYAKFYRDLNSDRRFAVICGQPMVDAYGQTHELAWRDNRGVIESGNNIFHAAITGLDTRLVALSNQPGGMQKNEEILFHPQLFIRGSEVNPLSPFPRLLETDPVNGNYHNNVLEWDYGVFLRRIRLIEGRFLGSWVFVTNPGADVRIRYNQSGKYRLRLGQFAVTPDEEFIPAGYFGITFPAYPLTISDTATFYPDADPETTTVDGRVLHVQSDATWAGLVAAAGNSADDSGATQTFTYYRSYTSSGKYDILGRSIFLFNVSIAGTIAGAVFSVFGCGKLDGSSSAPNINLYSSNPAANNVLQAGDFDSLGSTPFCDTPVTYAGWNTAGYNNFTLNAAGLSAVPVSGIAKLGLRNANYDAANSAPAWVSAQVSHLQGYASEQGTGYKPKLVITYYNGETKTSGDNGSGADAIVIREMGRAEQCSGGESSALAASLNAGDTGLGSEHNSTEAAGPTEDVNGNDTGRAADALKLLVRKAGTDMKLYGAPGETGMPNKEIHL